LNILVFSFYFSPDLCAGAFRAEALVRALSDRFPSAKITILTTKPNRYQSFILEALEEESDGNKRIIRFPLPAHKSGMLDQSKAFISYYLACIRATKAKKYDLVIGTSSRLMTAVLAAKVAISMRACLYLDIRDLFVDTIGDVLPKYFANLAKPFFSMMESYAFNAANHINLVSRGFEAYIKQRYPKQKLSFFTNGIDSDFRMPMVGKESGLSVKKSDFITVLYAGNVGDGQGLHLIVPLLARELEDKVRFRIIGDGGRLIELKAALDSFGVKNVQLVSPMPRYELLREYAEADVLFLHLNDYDAFRKVLPSKIFEYGASGKPIWAGVSGYASDFICREIDNSAVFTPCDWVGGLAAFQKLTLATIARPDFVSKFDRIDVMSQMAGDIQDVYLRRK
jgi:hypothetical protein